MQLDRTHVVIRSRSLAEICDLALLVGRRYLLPFTLAFSLGAIPFALMNGFLLGWIPLLSESVGVVDEEVQEERIRYVWLMSVLVFLQTPLASVFATFFVGQAIFESRPPWKQVFASVFSIPHRLGIVLGGYRGPFAAMCLIYLNYRQDFDEAIEIVLLGGVVFLACIQRAFRPNISEILLLERCPLVAGKTNLTAGRRSGLLHSPVSGDCFGRFIAISLLTICLTAAIFYFLLFLRGIFVQRWNYGLIVQIVLIPLSMWCAAAFSTIIHFLCYLDNRIRLEGWDVELTLRAETLRQFGTDSLTTSTGSP